MENLEKKAREPFFRKIFFSHFPYNVLAKLADVLSFGYDRYTKNEEGRSLCNKTGQSEEDESDSYDKH